MSSVSTVGEIHKRDMEERMKNERAELSKKRYKEFRCCAKADASAGWQDLDPILRVETEVAVKWSHQITMNKPASPCSRLCSASTSCPRLREKTRA